MEFLINPNVSYVLLILGFITAVLALLTPGTGVLEAGALLVLALAGYGIMNLPFNSWAFAIMAVGVVPFVLSLFLARRWKAPLITVSALAFLAGSALLFRGEGWVPAVSPVLILLLTPITLALVWLLTGKLVEATAFQPAFDLDKLVGMTGQVSSDIRGEGTVYVNGEEWTARSAVFIPAGRTVRVLRRDGLALDVEPLKTA